MNAMWVAALLAGLALAGCASETADEPVEDPDEVLASVFERAALPFNVTGDFSRILAQDIYSVLPPVSAFIGVDLPEAEGGAAVDPTDPPVAHLGLFLPDIPGCDFANVTDVGGRSLALPGTVTARPAPGEPGADCQVPVIADAGPYWGESDAPADERGSRRLGEFLIQNFVPQGYAVAQISVMGSGKSNHCFDMFGLAEQLGVAQAVEWLGAQEWSNGNVGLTGRSYDGSTPWMAAAHAPEALKTIVPISGLSGLQDLVTWNGASESRIMTFHNIIYGRFGLNSGLDPGGPGVDPGPHFPQEVRHRATCPDWLTATPMGGAAYLKGDDLVPVQGTYWRERNFVERVLENYEGSLYMIHGLRDNNVDPHAGWIAHQKLIEKGLETKGLYGQWFHSYPDRPEEHGGFPASSVRFDWAQDLLEWFDHYLKATGPKPALHVEVQQQDGRWRVDDALEPMGATFVDIGMAGTAQISAADDDVTVDLGMLSEHNETVLGGLSSVTLSVLPTGPGGQLYVELLDLTDGETFGLSYGIMELRHATGSFQPVAPGIEMQVTIPLQYFSAALEAGHHLGMRISHTGNGFLPSPVVQPVIVDLNDSTLRLSTVAPEAYFTPPVWEGMMEEKDAAAPQS